MNCRVCGHENDSTGAFCRWCGASLTAAGASAEARKVVTMFFTDVAESTALGEQLDPELLAAGDTAGAEAALEQAITLNDEKGNLVAAQHCRERLAKLRSTR